MAPWLDHAIADTLLSYDFSYTAAADNVELYVGIAAPVGLVMIAATVLLVLLLFVIHKKRAKKHKLSSKLNYIVFEDCQLNYMFSLFRSRGGFLPEYGVL